MRNPPIWLRVLAPVAFGFALGAIPVEFGLIRTQFLAVAAVLATAAVAFSLWLAVFAHGVNPSGSRLVGRVTFDGKVSRGR